MVAVFRIYKRILIYAPERQLSHLEFPIEVAECLFKYEVEAPRVRLGGPTAPVPDYFRRDGINYECFSYKQTRCVVCKKNCRLKCWKCNKPNKKSLFSYIPYVIMRKILF